MTQYGVVVRARRQTRRVLLSGLVLLAISPAAMAWAQGPGVPMPPTLSAPPPGASIDQAVEVGGALGVYDSGLGQSNDQFFRYRVSKPNAFALGFDVGREHRFGETSVRGGVSFNKSLPGGSAVTVGYSSGSGEVLAPRYRFDFGLTQPIGDTIASIGYTRLQSKAVNASDGFAVGLLRYFSQWIVGGNARVDVGSPGRTISSSVGLGATWYRYKEIYIGGELTWGDVSYILLPDERAVVDYRAVGASVSASRWFNGNAGVNLRVNYGDTDIYRSGGVTLSVFREF